MDRWLIVSVVIHVFVGIFVFAFAGEPPKRVDLSAPMLQALLEPETGSDAEESSTDEQPPEEPEDAEDSEDPAEPEPTPPPPDVPAPQPTEKVVIPVETPKPIVVKPTARPTAKPTAKPKPKSTPKPTAKPAPRPTVKPTPDDRAEKLLKKIQDRRNEFTSRTSRAERTVGSPATGSSRTGSRLDPGTIQRYQDTYLAKVDRALRRNWTIPARQGTALRTALITITIEETGAISNVQWDRRSGDPTFDNSIMEAIRKAEPEAIPEDLGKTRLTVTVEFKDRS
jgi:TonB family protein